MDVEVVVISSVTALVDHGVVDDEDDDNDNDDEGMETLFFVGLEAVNG